MRILVTAGNTLIPIDRVRCITNIFTGRTGTRIARHAHQRGHVVVFLTSHPELVSELGSVVGSGISPSSSNPPATQVGLPVKGPGENDRWTLHSYRTFDDLEGRMEECICRGGLDVVIHCAAVSDYRPAGIYAPAPETQFREHFQPREPASDSPGPGTNACGLTKSGIWISSGQPALVDKSAGKVKSDEPELWLRLVRTPKLVDRIRADWHFTGILVKFKLEVDVVEKRLLEIAELSRRQSGADLMVANALETASTLAYLGPIAGNYQRIDRNQLPDRLLEAVESLHKERQHG